MFEPLARLTGSLIDGGAAAITTLDERCERLAASGVRWPSTDDEVFLRWAARSATGATGVTSFDLATGAGTPVPGTEVLVADGVHSVHVVPLRDRATLVALLVLYAQSPEPLSVVARRRLSEVGRIAEAMISARRAELARASQQDGQRLMSALADIVRSTDWRMAVPLAIDALRADRAVLWDVDLLRCTPTGSWRARERFSPWTSAAPASTVQFTRAVGQREVMPISEPNVDPRTQELGDYLRVDGIASVLVVPVCTPDRVTLALSFESTEPRQWTRDERRFASALASWLMRVVDTRPAVRDEGPERRLRALLDAMPERVGLFDEHGDLVYQNAALGEPPPRELVQASGDGSRGTTLREVMLAHGQRQLWELTHAPFEVDGRAYHGVIARDARLVSAGLALAFVAFDGKILQVNEPMARLLGRTPEELLAGAWSEVLGSAFDPTALRMQIEGSSTPFVTEVSFEGRVVEVTVALARDGLSRPTHLVLGARDITRARRAEALQRALADTLSEDAPRLFTRVCELIVEATAARCVFIARRSGAQLVPVTAWRDGATWDLAPFEIAGTACEAVRVGELAYCPGTARVAFPTDPVLAAAGAGSFLGAPLVGADGRLLGVLGVACDGELLSPVPADDLVRVCATRLARELERGDHIEMLATREEQLRQLTETAQETFWLAEWPSLRLLYASSSFEQLTGVSNAVAHGTRGLWDAVISRETREELTADLRTARQAHRVAQLTRSDGQTRWIQLRASLLYGPSGDPYRVAGSIQDITEMTLAQQALAEREQQLAAALADSERTVETLQSRLGETEQLSGMVGSSGAMRTVFRRLRQAAQSDVSVLIGGESGTGKELAAQALHALSERRDRPFIAINCAAIPETLLESELFGYVKGAFTGAGRDKIGLMQAAEGGTLFLDEIGDTTPVLQAKLLRALQERQIRRLGDDKVIPIDVRLVSASHRDLRALVAAGGMREDFYYRIRVFEVHMPALRDRREDIAILATHFVGELRRAAGKPPVAFAPDAVRALVAHRWPGNVRELRNAVEHALVTATGGTIRLVDLPAELRNDGPTMPLPAVVRGTGRLEPADDGETARAEIREALRRAGGNRAEAARLLGIGRVSLWKRMRRLGMPTGPDDAEA